jgi:hypothetical protein
VDRNRQPAQSVLALDAIAAAPVALGELHLVQQDELVGGANQIEVALPGDVARLNDRDTLMGHSPVSGRVYHADLRGGAA